MSDDIWIGEWFVVRDVLLGVAANETLVALTDDVGLAASVGGSTTVGRQVKKACLRMPILTTARTTAFMPALSPPDVRTAILILAEAMSWSETRRR